MRRGRLFGRGLSSDRLLRRLPKARLIRMADAAHAIHLDQPERFVEAVRSAIAGA